MPDEVLTHQDWKSTKKKYAFKEPKAKQDVGKTLDVYHKERSVKGRLNALRKVKAGFEAYLKENDESKAEKCLKDLIKNTNDVLVEIKKNGLESPAMTETLKAINDKITDLSLKQIWGDKSLRELLRQQLKLEFSLENIDFLEAVEKRKGAWIYEQWVAPKCAQTQVNLKAPTFKDLAEQYKSDPGKMTYRDAYDEIFALIERDTLLRLKRDSWDLKQEIGERMKLL